jgi:hypothetical protein
MTDRNIEKVSYGGWPRCYRLCHGDIELIATADVGPRIIRFGFVGGPNLFTEYPDQLGKSGEPWWVPRGGHRLWVAPEIQPDTYALDNAALTVEVDQGSLSLLQPVEPETYLQKSIHVAFTLDGCVSVTHSIANAGLNVRRLAPWALTQLAPGGVGFVKFPPRGCHDDCLQPTHPLVMWAYTDFLDERWQLNCSHLVLRQDARIHAPQKAGIFCEEIISGYLLGTTLFIKRARANPTLSYPDFHCSFEMFTNGDFLELETLGPLVDLKPGQSVSHSETWSVHSDIEIDGFTDAELETVVRSLNLSARSIAE